MKPYKAWNINPSSSLTCIRSRSYARRNPIKDLGCAQIAVRVAVPEHKPCVRRRNRRASVYKLLRQPTAGRRLSRIFTAGKYHLNKEIAYEKLIP